MEDPAPAVPMYRFYEVYHTRYRRAASRMVSLGMVNNSFLAADHAGSPSLRAGDAVNPSPEGSCNVYPPQARITTASPRSSWELVFYSSPVQEMRGCCIPLWPLPPDEVVHD